MCKNIYPISLCKVLSNEIPLFFFNDPGCSIRIYIVPREGSLNKNVSKVHGYPTRTILFHVPWTVKLGNNLIWH